jgi:hypothetical protein
MPQIVAAALAKAAMAAPAAAAVGTGAALKTGIAAGTALGAGFKASAGLLAPTLGTALPGIASAGGAGLAGLGGFGLKAGAGSLMPKFASLSATGLPTAPGLVSRFAPNLVGQDQVLAEFSRQGLGQGFPELGKYAGEVTRLPGVDFTKGALGNAPKVGAAPTMSTAPSTTLAESIRNANTAMKGPVNMSYAPGAQGISSNAAALQQAAASGIDPSKGFLSNAISFAKNPSMQGAIDYIETHPYASAAGAYGLYGLMNRPKRSPAPSLGMIRPYEFQSSQRPEAYEISPLDDSSERLYFDDQFIAGTPYEAPGPEYRKAGGGIVSLAVGGPVEQMAAMNSMGVNTGYPMAGINTPTYSNPMMQHPEATNVISPSGDAGVGAFSGEPRFAGGGGISDLGGYSDGGRLLKGPGDGVSDSIPAVIGERQPARLADGEFVVPARIVSELGNGSTEAGARKLYAMMDRVQKSRRKTVGKNRVAANTRADKHLPA